MALLDLVNSFRDLLRDGRVTTVAGASPDLLVQINLINRAARKLMGRRAWSFLHRDDGYVFFPASVTGTATFNHGSTGVNLGLTAGASGQAAQFSDGSVAAKVLVTGDSTFPDTSYRVSRLATTGLTLAAFSSAFRGTTGSSAFTIYANEARFPSDVANVLYVKNEEGTQIRFDTVDTFDDFDRMFPRESDRFGDFPERVAIGGQVVPTAQNSDDVTRGIGLKFFPPNDQDVLLRYGYVRRIDTLSDDTDEFVGVPDEVQDLVVSMAYEEALMGNIEDDPRKGATLRTSNELWFQELVKADQRDIGRRYVPRPFGSTPYYFRDVLDESVPEP